AIWHRSIRAANHLNQGRVRQLSGNIDVEWRDWTPEVGSICGRGAVFQGVAVAVNKLCDLEEWYLRLQNSQAVGSCINQNASDCLAGRGAAWVADGDAGEGAIGIGLAGNGSAIDIDDRRVGTTAGGKNGDLQARGRGGIFNRRGRKGDGCWG